MNLQMNNQLRYINIFGIIYNINVAKSIKYVTASNMNKYYLYLYVRIILILLLLFIYLYYIINLLDLLDLLELLELC